MAEWVWEARGRTGEVRKGVMEAENADMVQTRLRAQQLSPVAVKKKPTEFNIQFGTGIKETDLVLFVRQFATMIDAGLPLVQCLEILASQGDNPNLNKVLKDIKGFVEQGGTFSDGLRRHPKVFDELFINLINAGEMGGILDTILGRLAVYIEKRVKLQRQVRGALAYPITIFCVAMLVIAVMLTWVIPSFQSMFDELGGAAELPGITKFVIAISEGFIGWLPFIILGIVSTAFTLTWTYKYPKVKAFWHNAMLTLPIFGPVMRKIAVARFTRTLGTLLSSGVPILDALGVVAKASGNVIIERAIDQTAEKIREGRTMSEPLGESKVFPQMVVQMIAVGEQTGAMDTMLNKIADYYEEEVDIAVAALTSMLEPLMMVFIGGVVGTILIAMYMPIFSMAGSVEG